jgi:2-(1,2-epoxy-1,2-dihydrophenyl)acetyl-CoA isomerase
MPKPVIASLPGAAAGAGLSLALACDLRIAAESAVLTTAFAKVGFSGYYGGTFFLTHLVGSGKARELYYLSDRIDAKDAERLGLREPRGARRPARIRDPRAGPASRLRRDRRAYRHMKENLNRAAEGASAEERPDLEATHHVHADSPKTTARRRRPSWRRAPVFKGR